MALPKQEFVISAKDQTKQAFDSVASSITKIQTRAASISGALGFAIPAASLASLAAFTKSGINALDVLGDLSDRTGVAATTLAGFELVAKQSDTSLEALGNGLNKLTLFMANNSEAAKNLGLTATDPAEAFVQLAGILEETTSVQERNSIANKVLGKSYSELLPALNQGADALRRQVEEGENLSSATEESVKQAQAFNDSLDKLSLQGSNLSISLAKDLLPSFTEIAGAMKIAADEAGTLTALFIGLGGLGDLVFNGTKIRQAKESISDLEKEVSKLAARKAAIDKGDPIIAAIYGKNENETRLVKTKKALEDAKKLYDELANPKLSENKNNKKNDSLISYEELTKGLSLTSDKLASLKEKQAQVDKAFQGGNITLEKYKEITKEINRQVKQATSSSNVKSQAVKDAEAAFEAAEGYTNKLKEQAATLGLSDEALLRYELSQQKLTKSQLAAAESAITQITAFKQNQQAIKDALDDEKIFKEGDDRELQAIEEQSRLEQEALAAREADYETFYNNLTSLNEQLNVDLITNDTQRAKAQLELENQRAIERIQNLGFENEQVELLLAEQAEIFAKQTKQLAEQGTNDFDDLKRAVRGFGDEAARTFTDFVTTGKAEFGDLIESILNDLARLALQKKVLEPIFEGFDSFLGGFDFGSFFTANATGNVYSGPGINRYSNSVVTKPTFFPFAKGIGLMGEAGAEAILPLTRVGGDLGVKADGIGGSNVTVNIIGAPSQPTVKQSRDQSGGFTIDVMFEQVENFMAKRVARGDGAMANVIEGRYGLTPGYGAAG